MRRELSEDTSTLRTRPRQGVANDGKTSDSRTVAARRTCGRDRSHGRCTVAAAVAPTADSRTRRDHPRFGSDSASDWLTTDTGTRCRGTRRTDSTGHTGITPGDYRGTCRTTGIRARETDA